MLNQIRKFSQSNVIKIVMVLIVLGLILPLLQNINNQDQNNVVDFKYAKAITQQEFLHTYEKSKLALGYSNQDKAQLYNLKMQILYNLIQERLLNTLPQLYNLAISDQALKKILLQIPDLLNDQGKLDVAKLQTIAQDNNVSEKQLLDNLSTDILQAFVIQTFLKNYNPPKVLSEILSKNAREIYSLNLVSIDTNSKKFAQSPTVEDKYLEEFYEQNKDLFEIAEKRSFDFIYITLEDLIKNISISDQEANKYIQDNIEEFHSLPDGLRVSKAKNILAKIQSVGILVKLNDKIEDELAGGMNLAELSKIINFPLRSVKSKTFASCLNEIYGNYTDVIFNSELNDIPSPIELVNGQGIMIFQVTNVASKYLPQLTQIKQEVTKMWLDEYYKKNNVTFLEGLKLNQIDKYKDSLIYNNNYQLTAESKDFSPKVIFEIMNLKKGEKSKVFSNPSNSKLYTVWIKNISYAKEVESANKEKIMQNARETIMSSLFEELIAYLHKINNVKVNTKNIIFSLDL